MSWLAVRSRLAGYPVWKVGLMHGLGVVLRVHFTIGDQAFGAHVRKPKRGIWSL